MKNLQILLARPQAGENIGATARVMKNFGIDKLKLINPRDGWPNPTADKVAASAADIIKNAYVYNTLPEALLGVDYIFAVTARPRNMHKEVIELNKVTEYLNNNDLGNNIALLFGSEQSGLTNEEISYCNAILTINTNPEYASLNLSHAVGICCYELSKLNLTENYRHSKEQKYVEHSELIELTEFIISKLEKKNFFKNEEMKKHMQINLRNIFSRNQLNENELRTLYGVFSLLNKNKNN